MMDKNKSKLWRFLKLVITLAVIAGIAYFAMIAGSVALIFMATSDHTELYGDIIIPDNTYYVGDPLPMEFIPPEDLEDIQGLMWDVYYEGTDIESNIIDNLIEGEDVLQVYSQEEVDEIFGKTVNDISRIAIYHPPAAGTITIDLAGFYRQTNPQYITQTEVIIHEK